MDYLPLILTTLSSILATGFITRILTIKQERKKLESEVDIANAKVYLDLTDVQQTIRKNLLEDIEREKIECDDRINKLKEYYEEKMKHIIESHERELESMRQLHTEEISIFQDKIDNLIGRVTDLELKKELV